MEIHRRKKLVLVAYDDTPLSEVPKRDEYISKIAVTFGGVIPEDGLTYDPATEEFQSRRTMAFRFPSVTKAKECATKLEDMRKFVYCAMIKCGKDGNKWQQATVACKHVLAGAPIGTAEARDESDPDNVEHAYIWCKNCDKTHLVSVCSDCISRRFGIGLAATAA
jgi:hypothetical protein